MVKCNMGFNSVLGVQVDICFRVKSTEAELIKNTAVLRLQKFFNCVAFWHLFFFGQYHLFSSFLITYWLTWIPMHPGLIFVRFCGVMSGLAVISPLVIIFYSLSVEIKWNNPCNKMAKILMDYNSSKLASNIRYPRRVFCYQESCLVFSRFMYLNTFFALYQWETTGVSFLTIHSLLFFTIILPLIFLVVPLKYTSPRSCEVKCKMSHWGWPSDPTLRGVHPPNPSAIFLHLSD